MSPSEPSIPTEAVTGIKPLGPRIVAWGAVLFLVLSWMCLALTRFGHHYDFVAIFYIPGLAYDHAPMHQVAQEVIPHFA